jgi:hypothetical protein
MDKETLRMQMLAGIITESQYKTQLEEAVGDIRMSGMHLIQDLTPEIESKIEQLKKDYPKHQFTLTSNSNWKPSREDLRGTYTLSYSGPGDDTLEDLINNIEK